MTENVNRGFWHPLPYCLESQLGASLWIPGNFPSTRFLSNPIMAPSIMMSLSLLPSVPPPTQPSCFLMFSFSSLPSPSPHSQYTQKILTISSSKEDPCTALLGFFLLLSFSGIVNCMQPGYPFPYVYYPLMSEYIPCLSFWVWVTSLRMVFFQFHPLACKFQNAIVLYH